MFSSEEISSKNSELFKESLKTEKYFDVLSDKISDINLEWSIINCQKNVGGGLTFK